MADEAGQTKSLQSKAHDFPTCALPEGTLCVSFRCSVASDLFEFNMLRALPKASADFVEDKRCNMETLTHGWAYSEDHAQH